MKAVFFDLDNTLYSYNPSHEAGLEALSNYLQKEWNLNYEETKKLYYQARELVQKQLKNQPASHHRLLYMIRLCELNNRNPLRYATELEKVYWHSYFQTMKLYEGVLEVFQTIKKNTLKIGIITDLVTHIQYEKLKHLQLIEYIDMIVTSEEAGTEKPSSEIFELALTKLNLQAKDVIMVGDNYEKDILGAWKLGIKSYWFQGKRDSVQEKESIVVFQNIKELLKLLNL